MKKLEAELVINTNSKSGKAIKKQLLKSLHKHNINLSHINEIKHHQPIDSLIKPILTRKPSLLIVCGGDGTISEVVDHLAYQNIEIGLIPIGTTNNFARSLNIPLELEGAIKKIKNSSAKYVDLGKINNDYFTNVTGIGLSAVVASTVSSTAKKRFGRLAYAMTGISQLIKHKPFLVTIGDKDQELKLNFETHQVIIANGRYHAGKEIAADAKVNNRELIVFALGGRSKLSFLWDMIDFYIGKRKHVIHSSYLIGNNIYLETSNPTQVETDGEVKFETPINASVAGEAIKVRYTP